MKGGKLMLVNTYSTYNPNTVTCEEDVPPWNPIPPQLESGATNAYVYRPVTKQRFDKGALSILPIVSKTPYQNVVLGYLSSFMVFRGTHPITSEYDCNTNITCESEITAELLSIDTALEYIMSNPYYVKDNPITINIFVRLKCIYYNLTDDERCFKHSVKDRDEVLYSMIRNKLVFSGINPRIYYLNTEKGSVYPCSNNRIKNYLVVRNHDRIARLIVNDFPEANNGEIVDQDLPFISYMLKCYAYEAYRLTFSLEADGITMKDPEKSKPSIEIPDPNDPEHLRPVFAWNNSEVQDLYSKTIMRLTGV